MGKHESLAPDVVEGVLAPILCIRMKFKTEGVPKRKRPSPEVM
jgi:hypothetical protein